MNIVTVMITHKLFNSIILCMNKITREIANILQDQIDNQTVEIQNNGLSAEQAEEIQKFARSLSRNSPFFPYPLKGR
ncbi:hypothetical protein YTPLAS21_08360 [Candidatus Nitrosocosmicus sp.]|nr:hypothetical protein YTPLAS21_08360 [Candidatus Nitrosocosmicus sp.]